MKKLLIIASLALCVPAFAQSPLAQSLIKPGVTAAIAAGVTTNLPASVRNDVALWANKDGTTANTSLLVSTVGTNALATNIITFTLQTVPDGVTVTTDAQNRFSFALTNNGTTVTSISTNIPTATLQGSKAIRLVSIVTGANGAAGGSIFVTNKIVGFAP